MLRLLIFHTRLRKYKVLAGMSISLIKFEVPILCCMNKLFIIKYVLVYAYLFLIIYIRKEQFQSLLIQHKTW